MEKSVSKFKEKDGTLVNEQIRRERVQVIDEQGNNLGEMPTRQAINRAMEVGLDLVMVGEKAGASGDSLAITKIMDFGKFLYDKKKKSVQSKKNQAVIQIKEIKLRPKIGPGDYATKMEQAASFLEDGKHVKFTLQFRGRQPVSIYEVGTKFFERITSDLNERKLGTLVEEKETKAGPMWSRIYYIKK